MRVYDWKNAIPFDYDNFKDFTHFENNHLKSVVIAGAKASFEYWASKFKEKPIYGESLLNSAMIYQHASVMGVDVAEEKAKMGSV